MSACVPTLLSGLALGLSAIASGAIANASAGPACGIGTRLARDVRPRKTVKVRVS
jgi:hypothetical protein